MLIKLQHLDTNCFHILGSIKASANSRVSLPPLENLDSGRKHGDERERVFFENPNGASVKHFRRVYRKPHDTKKCDIFRKSQLTQLDLQRKSDNGITLNHVRIEKKQKDDSVKARDSSVEKARAKCSTKWGSYGGCIPAILQALETVKDLDEALKPWAGDLNNKERSIILKEQSNWPRAFEIFEWFKKSCYEVNVIHYNIMLRIMGKARRWSLVEEMWDEMINREISPINSTYGTLIDVYSKGGCKEKAIYWMDMMNKKGMEPDEVTMSTVVQMYKKSSEFNEAEKFFMNWSSCKAKTYEPSNDSYPSRASLNLYTYNTLIDTYGKAGNILEASRTFKRMLNDGIVPNTITFNTMMHICGNNGQLEEVSSLMQKMEELRCPFTTRTFNVLISIHTKHDNIDIAAKYFVKMKEARLKPDLVTYRTLLYAFSIRRMVRDAEKLLLEMDEKGLEIDEFTQTSLTRMYIEDGKLEKSWLWFKRFHSRGNMSSGCYSANIDAFGERGHVLEAENAFNLRLEKENVTILEFNVMIKAYGIGKRYDEACKLFDRMDRYGVAPDRCSYNCLIQILASADLPQLAKPYLMKMQEAGLVLDCAPYCALISSFAKLGQLDRAEELYKEMIIHNVQPDIIVYGVLINAFAEVGTMKKAVTYVDSMKNSGLAMNSVIYNSLIKLYSKFGYLKEAQGTYNLLQSSEPGPDIYSSNCMIDLYSERSMVKQAEEVFETVKKKGVANEFSFAMMVLMYKKTGMIDEAIRVTELMRELGLLTDLLSFNNVLALYAMDGRLNDAVETFKAMMESAIKPDDSTFNSLGALLIKCGVPKHAVGKLEVTMKKDFEGGLRAWIQTLSSVVSEDDDF